MNMPKRSHWFSIVALALLCALRPARAKDDELYVRIVQIKGTGSRGDKKAEMDKALEPLRAHLEKASQHSRYSMLGKPSTRRGASGKAIAFELENRLTAEATPTAAADKRIDLTVKVSRHDGRKDELVFETKLDVKDGATAVPIIEKALEGGALILAITASRDSL
jgi:hypothetical protein